MLDYERVMIYLHTSTPSIYKHINQIQFKPQGLQTLCSDFITLGTRTLMSTY